MLDAVCGGTLSEYQPQCRMPLPGRFRLTTCGEPLQPELANDLEHRVTRLTANLLLIEEALVHERGHAVENG